MLEKIIAYLQAEPVNIYLNIRDMENALKWFQIYVEDIINLEMDCVKSPFFAKIAKDISVTNVLEDNVKTGLYKAVLLNLHYEALREKKEYIESMEKLKICIEQ